MGKIYKGAETVRALLDGKVMMRYSETPYPVYLKIEGDRLFYRTNPSRPWRDDYEDETHLHMHSLLKGRFTEVNQNYLLNTEEWDKALVTFVKLREHPLAKPIKGVDGQYGFQLDELISFSGSVINVSYKIITSWEDSSYNKEGTLTAWFDTEEDIISAKKDIGEENLIQMFLTLNGKGERG